MTEYELIDALNSTVGLLVNTFSVYIAVTSGYLVCAYMVGARLTTFQALVVSVLYLTSVGVGTWAMFSIGNHATELAREIEELNPDRSFGMRRAVTNALTFVCALGVPACLKFMWDLRHPDTR
jgi:hypothetical protein